MSEKLYIVIPAYNEQDNIETVVREWHEAVKEIGAESRLVVIDDGSKDRTYQILCDLKDELPQLIPLTKENSGHGSTILFGYHYALDHEADFIFQTDSDGQTKAEEFAAFWDKRHEYDVIIGYRNHRQDGFSRIVVTKTLKVVLLLIFHLKITDANTPFRLMRKETLKEHIVKVPDDFFLANVLLTVLFVKNHVKLTYIPITFRPRQGGTNSINLKRIFGIGVQSVKEFRRIRKSL